MNGEEFGYAVDAGMTPLQAIEAGTANGPDTLGPQAPLSGMLKKGYDADFIALSEDPVENIKILAEPEKITHVWKGARCFKWPGRPVTMF
jgi:imidazolonepropionase-like amidohydrolase